MLTRQRPAACVERLATGAREPRRAVAAPDDPLQRVQGMMTVCSIEINAEAEGEAAPAGKAPLRGTLAGRSTRAPRRSRGGEQHSRQLPIQSGAFLAVVGTTPSSGSSPWWQCSGRAFRCYEGGLSPQEWLFYLAVGAGSLPMQLFINLLGLDEPCAGIGPRGRLPQVQDALRERQRDPAIPDAEHPRPVIAGVPHTSPSGAKPLACSRYLGGKKAYFNVYSLNRSGRAGAPSWPPPRKVGIIYRG